METLALDPKETLQSLVNKAQGSDEPVVVYDGDDECLVAMRPAVFERVLFDSDLLNAGDRESIGI